jgi:hypothetical protein
MATLGLSIYPTARWRLSPHSRTGVIGSLLVFYLIDSRDVGSGSGLRLVCLIFAWTI